MARVSVVVWVADLSRVDLHLSVSGRGGSDARSDVGLMACVSECSRCAAESCSWCEAGLPCFMTKCRLAFEQAVDSEKGKPDPTLVEKIGQALVSTHDYEKAILYFQEALRNDSNKREVRQDLAKLYVRLPRWDDAIRELEEWM